MFKENNKFEMTYDLNQAVGNIVQYMKEDKINMVKNVIYVLYDLYNSNFQFLLQNVSREYLINLYFLAVDNKPDTLLNYYKKSIINSSTNYKKI